MHTVINDLPFPRGTTASAGDALIVSQLGGVSTLSGLAGQTNPASNTDIKSAGVGGPGQLPTAAIPKYPYQMGVPGQIFGTTDTFVLGFAHYMQLRAVQYIPTSGSAFLVLDGHALALSNAVGWMTSVVNAIQGTSGALSVLPDPAYFLGRANPVYVKPYDVFYVVEQGPAVGIVAGSTAATTNVMSNGSGLVAAVTAGNATIGVTDGNFGNAVTTTGRGFGQYVVPSGNVPVYGTVSTVDGSVTAGNAVFASPFAPVPSGVTANAFTAAATTGRYMPSGGTNNKSNLILIHARPLLTQMPDAAG